VSAVVITNKTVELRRAARLGDALGRDVSIIFPAPRVEAPRRSSPTARSG